MDQVELQCMSSSNFQDGILLATKDGGRNWIELPHPPTVDQMTWISPNVGWIAGGVLKGDLLSKRNGRLTWQKQTPPVLPRHLAAIIHQGRRGECARCYSFAKVQQPPRNIGTLIFGLGGASDGQLRAGLTPGAPASS
jgi:hypothetical protein